MKKYSKICPICKNTFETSYPWRICCSPECSKERNRQVSLKGYYRRKGKKKFPSYACPSCGEKMKLDFDPRIHFEQFYNWVCPKCGAKRTFKKWL